MSAAAQAKSPAKEMSAVRGLNLERYMGRWYEIACFPSTFQPRDGRGTRATYSLRGDGTVRVLNETWSAGRRASIEGTAFFADDSAGGLGEARLRVRFYVPPFFPVIPVVGDYWVLHVDEEYQYALVGQPSRKYLWEKEKVLRRRTWNCSIEPIVPKVGRGILLIQNLKKISEAYQLSLEKKYPNMTQAPVFDSSSWADIIGSTTKGRVYGFGTSRPATILGDAHGVQTAWSHSTFYRDIRSSSASRTGEEMNRIIEERVQTDIQVQLEQFKKQIEVSQRTQIQQIQHMLYGERIANTSQPPTAVGSSFPVTPLWYPNYGMYGAQPQAPFDGQGPYGPFGRHNVFGRPRPMDGSSDASDNQQGNI